MTTAFATPPVRSHPAPAVERPAQLRLIDGGRSSATRRHRRRILAHRLTAAVALIASVVVLNAALAIGGPPERSPGVSDPISGSTYTVRSGDTMWDIALRTEAGGDVRDTVARLADANGGDVVRVGQTLVIPQDLRP